MFNLETQDYTVNKYTFIGEFKEGLARVLNLKGLWGFINKKGNEVIPCQYENISNFSEGLAVVQNQKGLSGYINKNGEEVIPFKYIAASDFKEGRAAVSLKGGKWIYIDKRDNNICKGNYDITRAYDFSDGFGLIRMKNRECAYVDYDGNLKKISAIEAKLFSNGFALSSSGIFNKNFEKIEISSDITEYEFISLDDNMVLLVLRNSVDLT